MTGGYGDSDARKICSLIVTYEELKAILDKLTSELSRESR
jgi:hypothetical protein